MTVVSPPFGTLAFSAVPANTTDKRYWGSVGSATYDVVTNATFTDGRAHRFTGASEEFVAWRLTDCGFGDNFIELGDGYQFRIYVEMNLTKIGSTDVVCFRTEGSGTARVDLEYSTAGNLTMKVYDMSGASSSASAYALPAGTRHVEVGVTRFQDAGTWKLKADLRDAATLQQTVTHTISGGNTNFDMNNLRLGHSADGSKGASVTFQFGRHHISWNNGNIQRNDQQWFRDWLPTVTTVDHPSSDVTSPDEWAGTGDATNLFENVNDATFTTTTYNTASLSTTKKELLMGWPAIGTVSNVQAVCFWIQTEAAAPPTAENAQFIAKNGSGTYKRQTAIVAADSTSPSGFAYTGVFLTDADGATWTETRIDDHDFGIDKPTSGANTDQVVSQMWRYVLHSGNAIKSLPYQRRASMRHSLVR